METIIRQLTEVDQRQSEQICELTLQLGYANDPTNVLQNIQNLLKSKHDSIFVAIANDKIVGWAHGSYRLTLEGPPFIEILGLVVDANFRKQQLGKKLVDAVKTWSQAFNAHKLRVRCNVVRLESHEFYKNVGFEEAKRQVVFDLKLTNQ